jgi:demethylmenaquinone methyltransferase/2-methoxy-6-polyprenyl-1,4-benzoquinol methylase
MGSKPQAAGVDKSAARVREMFAGVAPRYDFLNHLLSLNADRYWRWQAARRVPAREGPVLDLCTGTGDLALAYWRQTGGAARVVGADFCHPMLCLGAQKAARAGAEEAVRFVEADAQRLPFADDAFEVVCVAFGLRNVADTRRGLQEMARVCRPGGHVAVLEFSMPRWRPMRAAYGFYFRRVLPWVGQALSRNGHGAYHYLPASVLEFPQGEALAELMGACGLCEVSWRRLTLGVATLYVGRKNAKSRSA